VKILAAILGAVCIAVVLWDAFETIILPRRVTRRFRLARLFYRYTWLPYAALVSSLASRKRQDAYLSYYGPVSLPILVILWGVGLMFGFALLYWATGTGVSAPKGVPAFFTDLYFSGTTFFTLGLGDVAPQTPVARALVVVEAGMGFAFLALVIGYLPPLNQSFSRREVSISLLDARAGSPPSAAEMLLRHRDTHGMEALQQLLHEWELWSAEFLESHLSYPVLAYFRSQHENQSWLGALTTILDASALVVVGVEGGCQLQATRTFAMARHAVVDLAIVFYSPPQAPEQDRLSSGQLALLRSALTAGGVKVHEGPEAEHKLEELRRTYEPYIYALSKYFRISLPPWIFESSHPDNWQTSAWGPPARRSSKHEAQHF
jgi:Ion channel